MIVWDFGTTVETVPREDGTEETVEKRGDLLVWFHDSDPATDQPDQRVDWRAVAGEISVSSETAPELVKSEACYREIAAVYPNMGQREIRILGEAALEKIEQR